MDLALSYQRGFIMSSTCKVDKIGRINIEIYQGSYRLRFTYLKKRYCLTIGKKSKTTFKAAKALAQQIDSDIVFNQFDTTLIKYKPGYYSRKQEQEQKQVNIGLGLTLDDIWESYKKATHSIKSETTQKSVWKDTERLINKLSVAAKKLNNIELFYEESFSYYSSGTLERFFQELHTALNWAIEKKLIEDNPLKGYRKKLPKRQTPNRVPSCFSVEEIECIILAFETNKFLSSKSNQYPHSHYTNYIKFLAYTGCRPEEAIALTKTDIKHKPDGSYILINKAYSKGILKTTKTNKSRTLKCNNQLIELLNIIQQDNTQCKLLFPSHTDNYIDQHNFLNRYWKPIVSKLVAIGEVSEYLPCYNLRHTWITILVRKGLDPATIANIAGTSTEMIVNHYLAAKNDIDIPEI